MEHQWICQWGLFPDHPQGQSLATGDVRMQSHLQLQNSILQQHHLQHSRYVFVQWLNTHLSLNVKGAFSIFSLSFFPFLAPPTLSVPQQWVVLETESHLKCHADHFYPPPVAFSWTRAGKVIKSFNQTEGEWTSDGYYTAVGNLTLFPSREDQNVTFGCKVSHNGTYQELNFQLNVTCEWTQRHITLKEVNGQ